MKILSLIVVALSLAACGQGPQGAGCTVSPIGVSVAAPNGGSLLQCGATQQLILNGSNGQNGSNGLNGTNGTTVAPVQFCPGTSVYPSTFIEVGFCIDNTLYAVYSANGGFLTTVLPGSWGSNGINASCNFVVGNNCQIINN